MSDDQIERLEQLEDRLDDLQAVDVALPDGRTLVVWIRDVERRLEAVTPNLYRGLLPVLAYLDGRARRLAQALAVLSLGHGLLALAVAPTLTESLPSLGALVVAVVVQLGVCVWALRPPAPIRPDTVGPPEVPDGSTPPGP